MANGEVGTFSGAADRVKITIALLAMVAGIAGFYVFAAQPLVLRVLAVLGGLAIGIVIASFTAPGQQFFDFAKNAITETRKVVWPSRKETIQMTAIVFAFVLIMALFLWLTDKTLEWILYDLILGWRK